MKKIITLCAVLLVADNAFAYYGDYGRSDEMSGFAVFTLIVMIIYIILSIVILIRWWKMTANVEEIRQHVTHANPHLTYLIAIGEKDQAQKAALKMLVDLLYPIYSNPFNHSRAEEMNRVIQPYLPKMQKLGLSLPEYVTSGEKFIDYINGLTACNVTYRD